jgi:hypothetical protein
MRMKTFPHRPTIFFGFASIHFVGYLLAPGIELIAPAIAASIYLPLSALNTLGMPVFAISSGVWSPPSSLGWLIVAVLWAGVWWAITCGIAALFNSKDSHRE